jgi:SnoaL-like domain
MHRSSVTDAAGASTAGGAEALGVAFAQALARKDFDQVAALLHPEIDFRGLTPGRTWEASGPGAVIDDVLSLWFEESDTLERLVGTETDTVADRQRVAYRLEGHNPDGPFVLEQQAYYAERDGQIAWMRVLCSGFRPRPAD